MIRLTVALIAATAFAQAPVPSPQLVFDTYVGTGLLATPSSPANYGFAVDRAGSIYFGGSGPAFLNACGYLTKLSPDATSALWTACLPFTEVDGIAIDASGFIYVVGTSTHSAPSTVVKLTPDAQTVLYSTQLAGAYATTIVIDRSGAAYVAGTADATFQTSPSAYSSTPQTGAFLEKLTPTGTRDFATYLGFFSFRTPGLAIDSQGQTWIAGSPCLGASGLVCDPAVAYGSASTILKLNANGSKALVKQLFGGGPSHFDSAVAVAVDASDAAWIVGQDQSATVPTTSGALMPARPSFTVDTFSGYAMKLSPTGQLLYGSYLGNARSNVVTSVAVDAQGNPAIAMNTQVMVLNADGSTVVAPLFGTGSLLALDSNNGLYTAASTSCSATTPGVYQPLAPQGNGNVCVSKFDLSQNVPSRFTNVVNAASVTTGSVAPGELVTITGANLPSSPVVAFDGVPTAILSSDSNTINTIVPFGVPSTSTKLTIDGIGGFNVGVWPIVPALFTADGSGMGQLKAFNQDGSVNSTGNPAALGSVVTMFLTGAGAMAPPIADGALGPMNPPYPTPLLNATVTISNQPATILYFGQAPGQVAGVVQLDVQIPLGISTRRGTAAVVVIVGDAATSTYQPRTIVSVH